MSLRVLFLDDDPDRHTEFRRTVRDNIEVVYVWNVQQAKEALDGSAFDAAFLDHDLSDFASPDMYGYSDAELTGQHVARHIALMPEDKIPDITIHSWNPDGAKRMKEILADAGIRCRLKPFTFAGKE